MSVNGSTSLFNIGFGVLTKIVLNDIILVYFCFIGLGEETSEIGFIKTLAKI